MNPDDASFPTQFAPAPAPGLTPTGYQRTTGGNIRWQPVTVDHLQALLPQYEILSLLGHGGMGAVYKARQITLDREVAIKILPPEAAYDQDAHFVERFKNEARVMGKMNHPAIVHVYDNGETAEGQLYFVMEFVDGTDVQKMINGSGKLPPEYALAIAAHVCDALTYSHAHGVIHRDIKPANVIINMEGGVKVADFGLAKASESGNTTGLTITSMEVGTPAYMAPESQTAGMTPDHRADLYAVGVMLYHMLTGEVPRGNFKMPSLKVGCDARFDAIIGRAMETDRNERYQTAGEIRQDLGKILTTPVLLSGGPSSAAIPKQARPQKPMARGPQQNVKPPPPSLSAPRKPWLIAALLASVTGLGISGYIASKPATRNEIKAVQSTDPQAKKQDGVGPGPDSAMAASDSQSTWIKLWDTEDKARKAGVKWKDGVLVIDAGRRAKEINNRDIAFRASLRVSNDTSEPLEISVRVNGSSADNESRLFLTFYPKDRRLMLKSRQVGHFKTIGTWDLASSVEEGDWLLLEVRAIAENATISVNGRILGTVRNEDITGSGSLMLFGRDAQVRDVAYLPLDKPTVTSTAKPVTPMTVEPTTGASAKTEASIPPSTTATGKAIVSTPAPSLPVAGGAKMSLTPTVQEVPSASPTDKPALVSPSPSLPPELTTLHQQFLKLIAERVTASFDLDLAKLNTGYLSGLDREISKEKTAGHLDGVLVLEDEKKLIQETGVSPKPLKTGTLISSAPCPLPTLVDENTSNQKIPEALKKLRAIYRDAYAKLETTRGLNLKQLSEPLAVRLVTLESDFTKKDRIADAKQVREYRKTLLSSPDLQAREIETKPQTAKSEPPLESVVLKNGLTNTLEMKFVHVPGTKVFFCIHPTRVKDYAAYATENPAADGAWKTRIRDNIPVSEKDDDPVVGVSWDDANAFCAWLSKKEGKTYRLPTDHEWSIAVGIGAMEKVTKDTTPEMLSDKTLNNFPWGNQWPPPKGAGNYADTSCKEKFPGQEILVGYTDGFATTSPVMSFKANKFGLYDMGGNVWQWCEDWFNTSQKDRVLRGGTWSKYFERNNLLSSHRNHNTPDGRYNDFGFRCVVETSTP